MKKITIVLSIVLMTFATGLLAQNLNSAGKAYNKGIELAGEGKTMEAIESYNKCAEICAELGEVGEGLKIKAETQVTNLYMNMGVEQLKAKKYDSAVVLLVFPNLKEQVYLGIILSHVLVKNSEKRWKRTQSSLVSSRSKSPAPTNSALTATMTGTN